MHNFDERTIRAQCVHGDIQRHDAQRRDSGRELIDAASCPSLRNRARSKYLLAQLREGLTPVSCSLM